MSSNFKSIRTKKTTKQLESVLALGFVMPFQPSLWDDKFTQSTLDYCTHNIEKKLQNTHTVESIKTMLGKLEHIFKNLNFNTHRKSLAVIISADLEKVYYLNYTVVFSVCTGNFISLLDLVHYIKQETIFFLLLASKEDICLYEYANEHLHKVYEQKPDAFYGYFMDADIRAISVITYLNTNCQQPIFIVDNNEQLIAFHESVPFAEIIFPIIIEPPYSAEMLQKITREIHKQWNFWLSKFHLGQITIAQKANALTFNYGAVLKALCNSTDGLILMEKAVKKELQKSVKGDMLFEESNFFIQQLERFVDRGNCIVIKENGLLKDWGGIVLLPNAIPNCIKPTYFDEHRISGGMDNLF
jgi:hypothetical protein